MNGFTELEAWWAQASSEARNAVVAEAVFGAEWRETSENWPGGPVEILEGDIGRGILAERQRPGEGPLTFGGLPDFSKIAAAWEVVEKMKADGWRWHMGGQYSGSQRPWCGFRQTAEDRDYIVSGDTVPEAISLAALKAVGYDPDEPPPAAA